MSGVGGRGMNGERKPPIVCKKCGRRVVHPDRRYALCLDCLMDELAGIIPISRYRIPLGKE
jgi:hypothetical protein